MSEGEIIIKGQSPIQRQREEDGTPMTRGGASGLRPSGPTLTLKGDLVKGSLAENLPPKSGPKTDPVDPISVVKSFLEKGCGPMHEDHEDTEKASPAANQTKAATSTGQRVGAGVVNSVAGVARTVAGSIPKP
jgi:hypothetical protein